MRRVFPLLGLSLYVTAAAAAAPVDISGGIEQFVWQEYDEGGGKLLKESGQRLFIAVEAEKQVSERWIYGFRGRLYSGNVDYDGQTMTGAPHSTSTDYDGIAIAADFSGRFIDAAGGYSAMALRFGVGGEAWRRHILPNNGVIGYTEEYVVAFGKAGLAYLPEQGWSAEAGLKYPFSVDEDVDLYNVSLSPQGAFSFYARAVYNINQRWSIKGAYDSYRFKRSDVVNGVVQPESSMDTFGISVGVYF